VKRAALLVVAPAALLLLGLTSIKREPIPTVPQVDLERFMGNWFLIASIPTSYEDGAHNVVETYSLNPDGTIATVFTYRKGGFDGPLKTMTPKGFVRDTGSNAVWGMQFFWPIRAEYLITYVSPDYTQTIVARTKRDHVWIMSRTPSMEDADYERLVAMIGDWGYDVSKLKRIPQRW
jgi:apolipoprotein D and lipocalin family protein